MQACKSDNIFYLREQRCAHNHTVCIGSRRFSRALNCTALPCTPQTVTEVAVAPLYSRTNSDYTRRFKPDRFLQQRYAEQEQATPFAAFGAGSRVCLGIHLAYIELRVATALFFRECRGARLALSHLDDMDMINFFGGFPKGRSCNITLRMR